MRYNNLQSINPVKAVCIILGMTPNVPTNAKPIANGAQWRMSAAMKPNGRLDNQITFVVIHVSPNDGKKAIKP